jgi:hypothetical protein
MKPTSGDGQNKSTGRQWPSVLKIASADEFRQSFAVAQLAVKLCQLKIAQSKTPLEKENLDPAKFLDEAWKLIESACDRVLREQTDAEYLAAQGGSHEAAENVIERTLRASTVPFQKLCNAKRNKGDSDRIHGMDWKVYRSKRAFEDLFWAYWNDIGEKWKNPKQAEQQGKLRVDGNSIQMVSKQERQQLAKLARNADAWKQRGEAEAR